MQALTKLINILFFLDTMDDGEQAGQADGTAAQRFSFDAKLDVGLLTEVVTNNPYKDPKQWDQVVENVNKMDTVDEPASKRCLKDREHSLIKTLKKTD